MAWIKRNLFFAVGGVVALVLLGGAGFYIYRGWSHNSTAFAKLNEIVGHLRSLNSQRPSPGNDKIDNTKIAREQTQEVDRWIESADQYFRPIPPIPPGNVTSESYAGALRRTINQLQREADEAGVKLPPQYDFSFAAQRSRVSFAPGSLPPLAAQLGEVKAICDILFAARINSLDGIQRVRVSSDDINGPQADYIDDQPVTNSLAVVAPYVITFRSFTPELSRVISRFAMASNTFIVKSVNVQPASAANAANAANPMAPGGLPGQRMMPGGYGMPQPTAQANTYQANTYHLVTSKGGLQTVLKEQLLLIQMKVDLVKLLPKS